MGTPDVTTADTRPLIHACSMRVSGCWISAFTVFDHVTGVPQGSPPISGLPEYMQNCQYEQFTLIFSFILAPGEIQAANKTLQRTKHFGGKFKTNLDCLYALSMFSVTGIYYISSHFLIFKEISLIYQDKPSLFSRLKLYS